MFTFWKLVVTGLDTFNNNDIVDEPFKQIKNSLWNNFISAAFEFDIWVCVLFLKFYDVVDDSYKLVTDTMLLYLVHLLNFYSHHWIRLVVLEITANTEK